MARILAVFFFFCTYGLFSEVVSHPYQIIVSHIEPKGIGYKEGYTSLALFFAPPKKSNGWTLFWDARSHIFNEGKLAINGGMGVRYCGESRLYGINSYYDFRQSYASYNQISLGFESLGKRCDFRINGYLPVGRTETTYDTAFIGIQDRVLLFSHKREFALNCLQGEAAFHVDEVSMPYAFSLGPYWMNGRGRNAWGAEARFAMDIGSYVRLEGNASYDNFFQWIGQGRLALILPFGPRKKKQLTLAKLSAQRVCRREIIPLDRERFNTPAINQKTGAPYLF